MIQKIGVLTSGGDSPGMNCAIRAVVRSAIFNNLEVVGIKEGYRGMLNKKFIPLKSRDVSGIINRGGTFLKSSRCPEFKEKKNRLIAFKNLKEQKIDALIVIGGDGSFTGALEFENEMGVPIIGIPGTIDNDIFGTNYTIGYDTALNTVVDAIDKIRDTAYSHSRLFFIEVMGRDAGFIALNSGIASGAEDILIPEEDIGFEKLEETLKKSLDKGKSSSIVVVAEGDKTGKNVFELSEKIAKELPQYNPSVVVLGHIQRGGSPTCFDRVLASRLGVKAIDFILEGKSECMVGIQNTKVILTPFEKAIKENNPINKETFRISEILGN